MGDLIAFDRVFANRTTFPTILERRTEARLFLEELDRVLKRVLRAERRWLYGAITDLDFEATEDEERGLPAAQDAEQLRARFKHLKSLAGRHANAGSGSRRSWSNEEVLKALRTFHELHGRMPRARELGTTGGDQQAVDLPSYDTVRRHFGGLAEAAQHVMQTAACYRGDP